ncbi:MAG: general secretion pathway protein K [Gammaproteobacteria bacterium]|jgi:general secretion pathway protein K
MLVLCAKRTCHQTGVALITVLLIVAMLTAIVTRLSLLNEIWIQQVENSGALAQAAQATRAAQIWVGSILEEDKNNFDASTDDWAQPMIPIPIAWGVMFGWIEDMQSRINLNNLVDDKGKINPLALEQFENLLQQLELDPGIAQAVADWIDADGNPSGYQGAEDLYYLNLERPYFAANRPFIDEQELLLVKGIDQSVWNRLRPFITVLPEFTTVNVNTASPEVLAAMLYNRETPRVLTNETQKWVDQAQVTPYESIEDFTSQIPVGLDIKNVEGLDVTTAYFKAHTQMSFDNVEHKMVTLYHRLGGDAIILHQSRTFF